MNVINSVPDSKHLLHGDPHPANVMLSDKGMIFIDLSDMRTGNEILDLVYLNRTLIQYNKLPSNTYSLGVENSKKLWELFFDEYYKELNEQDKKDIYNKIDLLALVNITEKFMMKNPDNEEDIKSNKDLVLIASSKEAGAGIVRSKDNKFIFIMGHAEYDRDTLDIEYKRDLEKGLKIDAPKNYYVDDKQKEINMCWTSTANLIYMNWLNHYVYQLTPYNIDNIK